MVAFDATIMSLLIYPNSKAPKDPSGKPVTRCQERIEHLIQTLQEKKEKILIPTPALSEVLVVARTRRRRIPKRDQQLRKVQSLPIRRKGRYRSRHCHSGRVGRARQAYQEEREGDMGQGEI